MDSGWPITLASKQTDFLIKNLKLDFLGKNLISKFAINLLLIQNLNSFNPGRTKTKIEKQAYSNMRICEILHCFFHILFKLRMKSIK